MEEQTYRCWDIILKLIAIPGAILVFAFSVYSFLEAKEKDYKSKYYEKQVNICIEGSDFATKFYLEIYETGKVSKENIAELYQVTFGKGRILLSDKPLGTLQKIMQDASSCSGIENLKCDSSKFNTLALLFAQQCRKMLSESWETPLEEISDGQVWVFEK
ncbi:hypothetical protein AL538_02915 [Vibrio harveyi]|uniref:Uncharacterized protein n=2 Tax=Vibrio TaxID=662 RepID=A0ABM5XUF4_VIBHA|nr:hypothetical protein [Vibrio harveyi]AMF96757.1 hypothetical protein AL538_02915 [Vibrio harveyi]